MGCSVALSLLCPKNNQPDVDRGGKQAEDMEAVYSDMTIRADKLCLCVGVLLNDTIMAQRPENQVGSDLGLG